MRGWEADVRDRDQDCHKGAVELMGGASNPLRKYQSLHHVIHITVIHIIDRSV